MKSISTEGRVGGRVLLRREGWEMVVVINTTGVMELLLDRTYYFNCFSTAFLYVKILAQGRGVSSFFCHAKNGSKNCPVQKMVQKIVQSIFYLCKVPATRTELTSRYKTNIKTLYKSRCQRNRDPS